MESIGKLLYKLAGYLNPSLLEGIQESELEDEAKAAEMLDKVVEDADKAKEANAVDFSVFLRSVRDLIKDGQLDKATKQIDDMLEKLAKYPYPARARYPYPYPYPKRSPEESEKRDENEDEAKDEGKKVPDVTPVAQPKESEKVNKLAEALEEQKKLLNETKETLDAMKETARKAETQRLISDSELPTAVQGKLRRQCENLSESQVKETIEEERKVLAELFQSNGSSIASPRVEVTESQREKYEKAMDAMLDGEPKDGVQPFRSIQHAFRVITGRTDFQPVDVLEESARFAPTYLEPERRKSIFEGLETSDWPQVLGDSIHRKLIREYSLEDLNTWRVLVSDFDSIKDFRDNPRVRYGGYGLLDVVGERDTYQSLTSPSDEEAKYKIQKRGGLEDLTIEMIANDDIGALRRIPQRMGRAAALTLYQTIFNLFKDNPLIYDGVNFFDAAHGNTGTSALASAALSSTRQLMMQQAPFGIAAERLGMVNAPKWIIVPAELEDEAWELTRSAVVVTSNKDATVPNIHQKHGIDYIVVSYWTDATDWIAVADPKKIPTIEVGFWNGRQEPELFVQDQPAVGSAFTADKITYKIRHVWGYAVLDYRPFYKHVVAG